MDGHFLDGKFYSDVESDILCLRISKIIADEQLTSIIFFPAITD